MMEKRDDCEDYTPAGKPPKAADPLDRSIGRLEELLSIREAGSPEEITQRYSEMRDVLQRIEADCQRDIAASQNTKVTPDLVKVVCANRGVTNLSLDGPDRSVRHALECAGLNPVGYHPRINNNPARFEDVLKNGDILVAVPTIR
jgi:hypothetical protein